MRGVAILFTLVIITASLVGCTQSSTGKIDAGYCANEYYKITNDAELSNESFFEKCAMIGLILLLNDEEVINGTSFVGLDASQGDVIIIQMNKTTSILINIDVETNSDFSIISLNQSEYEKFVLEEEYEEIGNLSGMCLDICSYETELSANYYYLLLRLDNNG
ncbi:MAG: hypothetical protein ACJZ46_02295 [Candidatus Thalassarchaeaceae archaeon]